MEADGKGKIQHENQLKILEKLKCNGCLDFILLFGFLFVIDHGRALDVIDNRLTFVDANQTVD